MILENQVSRSTIPAQSGTAFVLAKGQKLRVIDPMGSQVSDLSCFSQVDPRESLSSGRSIDYNDSIYLSTGDILYSNRSRPLLQILNDSCGRHDFLLTPCSLEMFRIVDPTLPYHRSCHENLARALQPFQIPPDSISTTFNIFMNVVVSPEAGLKILPPLSRSGDEIIFEAMMNLVVGLTACSHEETNDGACKPIHYEVSDIQ